MSEQQTITQTQTITGWHFAGATLRDDRPLPKTGEKLTHTGAVVPCNSGYHLSERAIDALGFAPGLMVARVRGGGVTVPHGAPVDKWACETRTCLSEYVDARAVIGELAETWARRALRDHAATALRAAGLTTEADKLASLPDNVSMAAAGAAAVAAWDAAGDAARAAGAAAVAAAVATRDAAWDAARAAWAAGAAAGDAARAAGAAENELQNKELETALMALLK